MTKLLLKYKKIFNRVVCEKFLQLTSGNPTLAKRKVLAGIVMTNDDEPEDMKVNENK